MPKVNITTSNNMLQQMTAMSIKKGKNSTKEDYKVTGKKKNTTNNTTEEYIKKR